MTIITMIIIIKHNNVKSNNSNDNMNVYIYNIKIHGDIANKTWGSDGHI